MTATIIPFPIHQRPVAQADEDPGIIARCFANMARLRSIGGITLTEYDEMRRLERQGFSDDEQIKAIVKARNGLSRRECRRQAEAKSAEQTLGASRLRDAMVKDGRGEDEIAKTMVLFPQLSEELRDYILSTLDRN